MTLLDYGTIWRICPAANARPCGITRHLRGRGTPGTPSPLACQAGPIRSKRSSSLLTVAPSSRWCCSGPASCVPACLRACVPACLRACVPTCGPPAGFVATYPPTCSPCVLAPSIRQGCRAEGSGGTRDEGVVPAMWHYSRMLHAAFLCCMLPVLCCMLHLHIFCCTHAGRVLATSPADAVLLQPDFERCA